MNYFDDPESKLFSFESYAEGLDETTFAVISFTGKEAISQTYDFEIMLLSDNREIVLEDVLQAQATLTLHRGDEDVLYNGIIAEFEQLHEVNDVIFYRARLVPKLWWLNLTHHNQVFLDQSVPEIVEGALRDGGLESEDFDVSGLSGYEELSYSCQYDESHFNYVSRLMERQGIYYYFLQEDDGEILVLTDTKFSHEGLKEGAELFYNPASGLEGHHLAEAIGSFSCRQKQLPAEIILKDFNYEKPSLDITSEAEVDPVGRGITYLYGEYFATEEEGERFAGIRAEELLCQKQVFHGESTVPYMMPGFTFTLNNHYRDDFNQDYLVVEVQHEGNQTHMITSGIATDSERAQNQSIYKNSFTVIPADVQYRPERLTIKPRISGTIHAKIDSEVDSKYAQMDEQGRYRVKLPFDINDEHLDGKGSAPLRMMQSYAGENRGMQFPLVKGTEVLLTFIEGNPDRPVIAGAVSNPETRGPVNAENQSESVIQTGGSNRIRMEDKMGSQRVVVETPYSNSWIRMGAHNDPITMHGQGTVHVTLGDDTWDDDGADAVGRDALGTQVITPISPIITDESDNPVDDIAAMVQSAGRYTFTYTSANTNTATDDVAIRTVIVAGAGGSSGTSGTPAPGTSDGVFNEMEDADGIRIHTAGSLWHESLGKYATYVGTHPDPATASAKPASASYDQNYVRELMEKFGTDYNPTNLLRHPADGSDAHTAFTDVAAAFSDGLEGFEFKVSSLDTFTTQEGNIYDFGGYWNYNLGNSYEENFMLQAEDTDDDTVNPELNKTRSKDLLDVGGPHWGGINWPENSSDTSAGNSSAFSSISADDTKLKTDYDNSSPKKSLWVSKSFGDAYEFTKGDSISVTQGSSLEVQHGGRHVEVKYSGSTGAMTGYSKSESGESWEKKWTGAGTLIRDSYTKGTSNFLRTEERTFDRNTGDVCSYETSQGTGMASATFSFDYSNKTSAGFNFGLVVSSEVWGGMKIESETYLGMKIHNGNYIGGEIDFKTYVGLKLDMTVFASMALETKNDNYEFVMPGVKVEGKVTGIKSTISDIKTKVAEVKAKTADVDTTTAKVNTPVTDVTV